MSLRFGRDAYVRIAGLRVSDHNRSEVEQSVERIGSTVCTARGRMRKNYVADKKTFTVSWDELPGSSSDTVDGRIGAEGIISLYNVLTGEFVFSLVSEDDETLETYDVVFTDFSYSVRYRYDRYYYNISMTLEEV